MGTRACFSSDDLGAFLAGRGLGGRVGPVGLPLRRRGWGRRGADGSGCIFGRRFDATFFYQWVSAGRNDTVGGGFIIATSDGNAFVCWRITGCRFGTEVQSFGTCGFFRHFSCGGSWQPKLPPLYLLRFRLAASKDKETERVRPDGCEDASVELASPKTAQSFLRRAGGVMELATPKTALHLQPEQLGESNPCDPKIAAKIIAILPRTGTISLSLADRLLERRFSMESRSDKNSEIFSEDSQQAVDGHCLLSNSADSRVDGHPRPTRTALTLFDRILLRKYPTAYQAGTEDHERIDGV